MRSLSIPTWFNCPKVMGIGSANSRIEHFQTTMEDDPFGVIFKASNVLVHIPVYLDKTSGSYRYSSRFFLMINVAFYVIVQLCHQAMYNYRSRLTVVTIMYIIDDQLSYCLHYSMTLNGILQSRNIHKLLNLLKSIRQNNRSMFGGPRYAKFKSTLKWLLLISLIFRFGVHCVLQWTIGIISTAEALLIEAFSAMLAVASDTYFILINSILIVLRMELRYINDRLKLVQSPEQIRLLSKAHMDILPLMHLFTKCFAMPVLYCIMMLFFEGTFQMFQLYVLIASSDGDYSLMDVFYYVLWYVPFAFKLIITMHQAASTSNQVSDSKNLSMY